MLKTWTFKIAFYALSFSYSECVSPNAKGLLNRRIYHKLGFLKKKNKSSLASTHIIRSVSQYCKSISVRTGCCRWCSCWRWSGRALRCRWRSRSTGDPPRPLLAGWVAAGPHSARWPDRKSDEERLRRLIAPLSVITYRKRGSKWKETHIMLWRTWVSWGLCNLHPYGLTKVSWVLKLC